MSKKNWTVKGCVRVGHTLPELTGNYGTSSPLAGVSVQVSARKKMLGAWMTWGSWGTVTTKSDGSFSLTKKKDNTKRQFRVSVRFKDNDLVLYGDGDSDMSKGLKLKPVKALTQGASAALEGILDHFSRLTYASDWHRVFYDATSKERRGGSHDLGNIEIESGLAQQHGDVWYLYKCVFKQLAGFGSAYRIDKKVALKYPHDNKLIGDGIEAPYASPENYVIYVTKNKRKDWFSASTLLHELMHMWVYGNCTREKGLAWQLLIHGSTHDGRQAKSWTAFHEAIAEFCQHQLHRALFPNSDPPKIYGGIEAEAAPFSREFLKGKGVKKAADAEFHEHGWMSLFNLLVTPDLEQYDFNVKSSNYAVRSFSDSCSRKPLSFKELLCLFLENDDKDRKVLKRSQMTVDGFLKRTVEVISRFSDADRKLYKRLLDPSETVNPRDELCKSSSGKLSTGRPAQVGPKKPGRPKLPVKRSAVAAQPRAAKGSTVVAARGSTRAKAASGPKQRTAQKASSTATTRKAKTGAASKGRRRT